MIGYADPQCLGEVRLAVYLNSRIDRLRLSDLVSFSRLSDFLKWEAASCTRTIVKKIVLSTGEGGVNMRIYTTVGVKPTGIDLKDYMHEPRDAILDVLNSIAITEVTKVWMACERSCNCPEACLRLLRTMRLGNVYCISPAGLMSTDLRSINELHIDANLPRRCLDLLQDLNRTPTQTFQEFKEKLKMLVRVLTITEVHTTPMKREHFAALIGKMEVQELKLIKEPPGVGDRPAGDAPPALVDLKFAETQGEGQPLVHWNATDPRMNLLKLFYEGVDTWPCAEVIEKLCAWFSVKNLLEITFPKKRNYEDLERDLTATLLLLKAFTGEEIKINWFCERPWDKIPTYKRLCDNITQLYKEDFPVVLPKKYSSEEEFLLELCDENDANKTLHFTFSIVDPPVPEEVEIQEEEPVLLRPRDPPRDPARILWEVMMVLQAEAQDGVPVPLRLRDPARFEVEDMMRMQMEEEEEEARETPHRGD